MMTKQQCEDFWQGHAEDVLQQWVPGQAYTFKATMTRQGDDNTFYTLNVTDLEYVSMLAIIEAVGTINTAYVEALAKGLSCEDPQVSPEAFMNIFKSAMGD